MSDRAKPGQPQAGPGHPVSWPRPSLRDLAVSLGAGAGEIVNPYFYCSGLPQPPISLLLATPLASTRQPLNCFVQPLLPVGQALHV